MQKYYAGFYTDKTKETKDKMPNQKPPFQGTLSVSKIIRGDGYLLVSGIFTVASGVGQFVLNRVKIEDVLMKNGDLLNQKKIYTNDNSFIPPAYR